MNFIGLHIKCDQSIGEMLMAEISLLPYDTFEEHDDGLSAYCEEKHFDEAAIKEIVSRYESFGSISYEIKAVERINWNEEWEKNYDPVYVNDQILVKAIFHDIADSFPYIITINPKMSFGTGHHATTSLMLKTQLGVDHQDKSVYDFGSGTGVLAIMAQKLGASKITATDVDDWCIENSKENFSLNDTVAEVLLGPVASLNLDEQRDIVLANINKNVLLDEISQYDRLLKAGGKLFLSGFYKDDIPDLEAESNKLGLKLVQKETKDNWAVLLFEKPTL